MAQVAVGKMPGWSVLNVLLLSAICCVGAAGPVKWDSAYSVQGILKLPYAEIKEPFMAYFDLKANKSRIDYYGGVVQTVQIPGSGKDFGKSYKIAPMTTETVTNTHTCFLVNGSKEAPVTLQAALPDLTGFKMISKSQVLPSGENCEVWQNVTVFGTRKNTYTMWVELKTGHPKRYEMMGYDSLLGSHYDKYYIDYSSYTPGAPTPSVFNISLITKGKQCVGFPGPGLEDHRVMMNPMQEYINNDMSHVDPMFDHFKRHHGRTYKGKREDAQRKATFMHNVRFVHSHNRAGHSYHVAINHLADWTDAERRVLRGRKASKSYNGGLPFNKNDLNGKYLPDQLDWRLYGAVTPVKDQAVCGSCWSFGTTGHIEGAYFLKTGQLVRLSQQELIDCSWGEGNNGCDGGEDYRAYQWIKRHGLAAEDAYGAGSYLGQDSYCNVANATAVVKTLKGYVNVTSGDLPALKMAMAEHGPISIGINAALKSFSFYSNGVFYDPKCSNKPDDLDHAVLAVGYGVLNGQSYWLVKNSWSTYWGNDGYVLISQKNNNCGVATEPTFVLL